MSRNVLLITLTTLALIIVIFVVPYEYLIRGNTSRRFLEHGWFKNIYTNVEDISMAAWHGGDKTQGKLLNFDEDSSLQKRAAIRKKERSFIKKHLIRQKQHVRNYTRCLLSKFSKLEETFTIDDQRYPLTFDEIMTTLHRRCTAKIFGKKDNKCQLSKRDFAGSLFVDKKPLKLRELKKELNFVRLGGLWSPANCVPRAKIAVIIPFRNRPEQLPVMLRYLHPILKKQNLLYRIFVVEQDDEYPFNRGKLMNIGFKEANRFFQFDCFVFHDVDLIPENDQNEYGCPSSPRHLSVAVDKFDYKLPYNDLFGGVEMFSKEHFNLVNGFSNSYWGWGAEDDDLYKRIVKNGLKLTRPSGQTGRYTMIKHKPSERPPNRIDRLKTAENSFNSDGLVALYYKVKKIHEHSLYTLLRVDLRMEDDMKY